VHKEIQLVNFKDFKDTNQLINSIFPHKDDRFFKFPIACGSGPVMNLLEDRCLYEDSGNQE
jgi:hypothetical protein